VLGVGRRHHGIVQGQAPFFPVMAGGHPEGFPKVALQRLQLAPVLQANQGVAGHGILDRNGGDRSDGDLRLLSASRQGFVHGTYDSLDGFRCHLVVGDVGSDDRGSVRDVGRVIFHSCPPDGPCMDDGSGVDRIRQGKGIKNCSSSVSPSRRPLAPGKEGPWLRTEIRQGATATTRSPMTLESSSKSWLADNGF
jgi:hypothetical protein